MVIQIALCHWLVAPSHPLSFLAGLWGSPFNPLVKPSAGDLGTAQMGVSTRFHDVKPEPKNQDMGLSIMNSCAAQQDGSHSQRVIWQGGSGRFTKY